MKKQEFIQYIDSLLSFYDLADEDKESVDWIMDAISDVNSGNVLETLANSLEGWEYFLVFWENKEEYEICSKVKRLMEIEMIEAGQMLTENDNLTEEQAYIFMELKHRYKI